MSLGVLGVVWTLQHAIGVNSGGIAAPFHVYQMTQGNNGGVVHIESMDPDSVRSMEARITDMEHGMRKIATTAVDTEAPPPMQPMPAELRGRTKKTSARGSRDGRTP